MELAFNWLAQGCLLAAATAVLLVGLRRVRADARWGLCWAALAIVLLLPVLPAGWSGSDPDRGAAALPSPHVVTLPAVWWSSPAVLLFLWSVWAGVNAVRVGRQLAVLRATRRATRPFPAGLDTDLRCWSRVSRDGRRARLVVSDGIRSAAVLGGITPLIAVAPPLIRRLTSAELDRVVVHEWAHVQRRDDLFDVLHGVIRIVAGWHPAVWWLERQLRVEREAACDEMAVEVTGSAKGYAASLAAVASAASVPTAAVEALAVFSPPGLADRVARIVAHARLATPAASARAAAAGALLLCSLAGPLADFRLLGRADFRPGDPAGSSPALHPARVDVPADVALDLAPGASLEEGLGTRPARVRPGAIDPTARTRDDVRTASGPRPAPVARSTVTIHPIPLAAAPVSPREIAVPAEIRPGGANLDRFTRVPIPISDTPSPSRPSWQTAAGAGTQLGRASRQAAANTAGAFSRFGRIIAGSF